MVKFCKSLIFCFMFSPAIAKADIHMGLDIGLLQDQKTITSRDVVQNIFLDFNLFVQAIRSYQFYLGFEYIYISSIQPNSTDTNVATMTSSNAMAAVKYIFGRRKLFSIAFSGSPIVQANYKITGASTDLWTGAAFASKLSIHPELTSSLQLNASLLYYSVTYTSKNSTAGSTSVNSFSRNYLIPSIGLIYNF